MSHHRNSNFQIFFQFGDVPEWSKGTVCKTVKPPVQIRTSPPPRTGASAVLPAEAFLFEEAVLDFLQFCQTLKSFNAFSIIGILLGLLVFANGPAEA